MDQDRSAYFASLAAHGIKGAGLVHLSLRVKIISCDNRYIADGSYGVLTIIEQGTDLSVGVAIFRHFNADGSLGAPVGCPGAIWECSSLREGA